MFAGSYRHTLDDKFRVIMPSKLRKNANTEEFFLTFNEEDGSLYLFTKHRWSELDQKYDQERSFDDEEEDRDFIRSMYSNGDDCTLDKQGRLSIPQNLRERAGIKIEEEILITGVKDRIELWAIEVWEKYEEQRKARLAARKELKRIEASGK